MRFQFDWDQEKEAKNVQKHKVSFRLAATIFRDPNQLSLFDEIHSDGEDRWITLGIDRSGILRVVVHTFKQVDEDRFEIRIISARKATLAEAKQYSEGTQ